MVAVGVFTKAGEAHGRQLDHLTCWDNALTLFGWCAVKTIKLLQTIDSRRYLLLSRPCIKWPYYIRVVKKLLWQHWFIMSWWAKKQVSAYNLFYRYLKLVVLTSSRFAHNVGVLLDLMSWRRPKSSTQEWHVIFVWSWTTRSWRHTKDEPEQSYNTLPSLEFTQYKLKVTIGRLQAAQELGVYK